VIPAESRPATGSIVLRLLGAVGAVLFLLLLIVAGALMWAHRGIRREIPPLPDFAALRAMADATDRPVQLHWINTASQLTPGLDDSAGGQRIVHAVFVLEWADGRILLVDAGMDAESARNFGKPMELLLGAEPVEVGRSVTEALGPRRDQVAGVVFTHLHVDHTQGISLLCVDGAPPLPVYTTPAQLERSNYTTRPGLDQVREASCGRPVMLPDAGIGLLPDMPGVGVIRVGGHTPGSQVVVAWVGKPARAFVLAGDVVFEMKKIRGDEPKPFAYRLLVTPESDEQLGKVRRWLRSLEMEESFTIIPSHDQGNIEALGIPLFGEK
jgi:glyoxylase-like metal-dependent hydrolase (beta-lactamase superfamily II)